MTQCRWRNFSAPPPPAAQTAACTSGPCAGPGGGRARFFHAVPICFRILSLGRSSSNPAAQRALPKMRSRTGTDIALPQAWPNSCARICRCQPASRHGRMPWIRRSSFNVMRPSTSAAESGGVGWVFGSTLYCLLSTGVLVLHSTNTYKQIPPGVLCCVRLCNAPTDRRHIIPTGLSPSCSEARRMSSRPR